MAKQAFDTAQKRNQKQGKAPAKETKTNHQTGYSKAVKNPTTNYGMSSHRVFCDRCAKHNNGCPITGTRRKAAGCRI